MKNNINIFLLFIVALTLLNCNKDDAGNSDTVKCNYKGISFVDPTSQKEMLLPEAELFVGHTSDIGNGTTIELYEKNDRDKFMFTTHVVRLNESGIGFFLINGSNYIGNVTCLKPGDQIGDQIIYSLTLEGKKGDFCVTIQDKI